MANVRINSDKPYAMSRLITYAEGYICLPMQEWLVSVKKLVDDELTWRAHGRDLAEEIFETLDLDGMHAGCDCSVRYMCLTHQCPFFTATYVVACSTVHLKTVHSTLNSNRRLLFSAYRRDRRMCMLLWCLCMYARDSKCIGRVSACF